MKKNCLGQILLVIAILFVAFIECTHNPSNGEDEFDPDGHLKKKYSKNQEKIAQCQALSFILGASEEQKCKANPSLSECKNYSEMNYFILAGNCYGYPNM